MPTRIAEACRATGQAPPATRGETVRCILESLALAYRRNVRLAGALSGRDVDVVHVVGGGARNELLCRLTADACGLPVLAGPVEATALGNVLVQARTLGADLPDLAAMRSLVRGTHDLVRYEPGGDEDGWAAAEARLHRRAVEALERRPRRRTDDLDELDTRAGGRVSRMRVALMVTCVNDAMFPDTGKAVVRLLRRLGVDVDFPAGQTCCAQPMVNTGYLDEAVPVVRTFVDAFEGYDAVVTPSGSCAGSARHQHAIVGRRSGDTVLQQRIAEISPKVYELSEFLVDVLGVEDVGASFPHRVTYHPTCHSLRMLGVGDRPTRLLRAVRGLRLVDLPGAAECCGFGGTFAVKNSDTSVAMGSDKARHVRETGAEVLVAGDNSCLMHVGGLLSRQRSGVRVMHLAEVLASTEGVA